MGVMGGTFDPVHVAHLIIAEEARVRLGLEEVVFIPAGQPWLKAASPVSPAEARLQMVRLAVSSNPFFRVSDMEVARQGPSYTVDTLQALHEELGVGAELYFIIGFDSLADLPRWKEPQRILQQCTLVLFPRPGQAMSLLDETERTLPGVKAKARVMEGPVMGISSTEIRHRVAEGLSVRYLVPADVEQFIAERGLYRKRARK